MKELEKHSKTVEARKIIIDFLEWCDMQDFELAEYTILDRLAPITIRRDDLIAKYLGIDVALLEKERRDLLKEFLKKTGNLK